MNRFTKLFLGTALGLLSTLPFVQNDVIASGQESTEITILHTNDFHSRMVENMSMARVSTLVNDFREANPNTLLLDAGDTVHGLPIANFFEGRTMIEVMNEIGFDAMVAGNHDFNFGMERLLELNEMADFPIMGANVVNQAGETLLDSYEIFEKDGVRIGVFGLSTPDTLYRTHPRNVEGLDFVSPSLVAAEMVAHLEPQTDIIIALGHLGIDAGSFYTSLRVIDEVPGIDLFVDGHSHTLLENGRMVNDTLLVQTGAHSNNLGVVELVVEGGELVSANARTINHNEVAHVPQDPNVLEMVTAFQAEVREMGAEVIGHTAVYLDGSRYNIRRRETNLGNFIADAMLAATDADLAFINGGGIRESVPVGPFTLGDLHSVLAFGGIIEARRVTGAVVLEALEHGTRLYPDEIGAFPQVSGVAFEINTSRPAGSRVENVYIGGQPLDLERVYSLAVLDFIGAGGDGYTMIADSPLELEVMDVTEAVREFLQAHYGPIAPQIEGRIVVTDGWVAPTYPTWSADVVFDNGDRVTYDGRIFQAQWWTRNQRPSQSGAWGAWMEIGEAVYIGGEYATLWTASRVFDNGDLVVYNNRVYRAEWWTRNQSPSTPWGPWSFVSELQ